MKKLSLILISFIILSACETKKTTGSLKNLISQKKTVQSKIDSLNKKLIRLDNAIAKLDKSEKLLKVTVAKIKPAVFKHYLAIQGTVGTDKNSIIRPELSGIVKAILVKETQKVKKGEALIRLDDALITDNINELKTQLDLAETTYKRQARLWHQKIGSEIQFLQAKTNKESLERKLKTLKTQLSKTIITAPFSGSVDAIIPKVGEFVSPQTPVIRLVNLDKVYIEADVSENYIGSIKKGTEAELIFENLNKSIKTKVNQVADFIDPNNRSFKIKIFIRNTNNELKPNLIANIKLNDFTAENAITLPSSIVQEDQDGNNFVYTIKKANNKNKVVKTLIKKGLTYNNKTLIKSGLNINSVVVNLGARGIKDGQFVTIAHK
ncbi:MAG: efflux RND transporter periplasmic adaptor subunit [Flavobacteriaceae bacterium]|nr:efflux RND transporter periplasmic adaptor subunit [Flavobacteriaceae bacterium]